MMCILTDIDSFLKSDLRLTMKSSRRYLNVAVSFPSTPPPRPTTDSSTHSLVMTDEPTWTHHCQSKFMADIRFACAQFYGFGHIDKDIYLHHNFYTGGALELEGLFEWF